MTFHTDALAFMNSLTFASCYVKSAFDNVAHDDLRNVMPNVVLARPVCAAELIGVAAMSIIVWI